MRPQVSFEPDDTVVLEYRNGNKVLTLYIGNGGIDYVRAWGPNIHSDMDSGPVVGGFEEQWIWLMS